MSTQTVHQTRRDRLEVLISEHGSIAALNSAMGMRRDDATFSLIRNQSTHSATGRPRVMGDDLARKVEQTLGLPEGWMDTPLSSVDERIQHVVQLLQNMSEPMRDQAVAVVDALAGAATAPPDAAAAPSARPAVPSPKLERAAPPRPGAGDSSSTGASDSAKPGKPGGDKHGSGGEGHGERHAWAVAHPSR